MHFHGRLVDVIVLALPALHPSFGTFPRRSLSSLFNNLNGASTSNPNEER